MSRAHIVWLWVLNITVLALVLLAAVLSDANSRLPGLDETYSAVVVASLAGIGVLSDIVLGWVDRKRWPIVLLVAVVYLVLLMPPLELLE